MKSQFGPVDPASRVPLHAQVTEAIRAGLADPELRPGSPLPSEAALQQSFGVSRSVVRQAIATLTREGLVTQRGRGRGSVVAEGTVYHRLVQKTSGLSTQIGEHGRSLMTQILTLGPVAEPDVAARLGGPAPYRLERLRSLDDEPIAFIRTWLPHDIGESLTEQGLTDVSLHATLFALHGIRLTGGRREVRAVAAEPALAEVLAVAPGTPLLLLEGHSVDQHGRTVEIFSTWHRADRVAFDIDVIPDAPAVRMGGAALPGADAPGTDATGATPADHAGLTGASVTGAVPRSERFDELARMISELAREVEELRSQER